MLEVIHSEQTRREEGGHAPSPTPRHRSLFATVSQSQRRLGGEAGEGCKLGRCQSSTAFLFLAASWLPPGSLVLTGSFFESASSNCAGAIWLNKWLDREELLQCPLSYKQLLGEETRRREQQKVRFIFHVNRIEVFKLEQKFLPDFPIGHLPCWASRAH